MTRSSKHQNLLSCSIGSGKKGTLVIRKSRLLLRRHRAANIAAANAAKKVLLSNMAAASPMSVSVGTPIVTIASSISTNGTQSTSGMSSLTQESTRYKKHGVTFNEFIEGNGLDWRKFG